MKTNELKLNATGEGFIESLTGFPIEKKIEENEYEKKLSYHGPLGVANMRSITINETMNTLHCDVHFLQDTTLEIEFNTARSLLCMYSLAGEIKQQFQVTGASPTLQVFRPEMLLVHNKESLSFTFMKNREYSFFLIYLQDMRYLKERYKERNFSLKRYRSFFNFLNHTSNRLYVGAPNLRLAEQVKKMNQSPIAGIFSHLYFEGLVYIILSFKVQQFIEDDTAREEGYGNLTKKECEEVNRLSDYIAQHPEKSFTVDSLCMESCLSPCKIQQGFKMMHGRTVADFIRNVRVEKAEELISSTDLNISEIVYSIGFTSRSYFAKIFKKKYNCSPKTYQNQKRKLAVTA